MSDWLTQLLDLLDAISAAEATGDTAGLALAARTTTEALDRARIRPVPAAPGSALDTAVHQAIAATDTDDPSLHGTIAVVHQRGWLQAGRTTTVLRPALVTVWRHP
jgi:molecular chaperone GrpE (heat shock protein)